jgi:hypothetical protein
MVRLEDLPFEVFCHICNMCLALSGSPSPITALSLVNKRWRRACSSDAVWDYIARHFYPAYPLLPISEGLSPVPTNPPTPAVSTPTRRLSNSSFTGGMLPPSLAAPQQPATTHNNATLGVCGLRNRRPTQHELSHQIRRLESFKQDLDTKHLVDTQQGYILHSLLCVAVLFLFVYLVMLTLALEDLHSTVDETFTFLWATYGLVFVSIITNIVMTAHFEPQPILMRVYSHRKLIGQTALAIFGCLFSIFIPTYVTQMNLRKPLAERTPWIAVVAPILCTLGVWQVQVIVSVRAPLGRWLRRPQLSMNALYHAVAHLTPSLFAATVLSFAQFLTSGTKWFLWISALPLLIAVATLAVVFCVDYFMRKRVVDGAICVCLCLIGAFTGLAATFPLRGFSLVPLDIAMFGFTAVYIAELKRKFSEANAEE